MLGLNNPLMFHELDIKIIPINWFPTKFHTFTFEGWNSVEFNGNCHGMSDVLLIASQTVKAFVNLYKNDYAFTEPQFIYRPDVGSFSVKIAMMENERCEEMKKKDKGNI